MKFGMGGLCWKFLCKFHSGQCWSVHCN